MLLALYSGELHSIGDYLFFAWNSAYAAHQFLAYCAILFLLHELYLILGESDKS